MDINKTNENILLKSNMGLSIFIFLIINILSIFLVILFSQNIIKDFSKNELISSTNEIKQNDRINSQYSIYNTEVAEPLSESEDIKKLDSNLLSFSTSLEENKKFYIELEKDMKENLSIKNMETIEIKEEYGDGWFKSYMDPRKITSKSSDQYKYKEHYKVDENGLYKYNEMYVVAMSESHFKVSDEVLITFDDGVEILCFVGDVKNKYDKNFNGLGHIHNVEYPNNKIKTHSSIVEFFVNENLLDVLSKKLGRVNSIISDGNVVEIKKVIKDWIPISFIY